MFCPRCRSYGITLEKFFSFKYLYIPLFIIYIMNNLLSRKSFFGVLVIFIVNLMSSISIQYLFIDLSTYSPAVYLASCFHEINL